MTGWEFTVESVPMPKQATVRENLMSVNSARLAYTIPQAVQCSGLSRSAIYHALKAGRLTARKAGRRTLIEDRELRRFIASLPLMGAAAAHIGKRSPAGAIA